MLLGGFATGAGGFPIENIPPNRTEERIAKLREQR